MEQKERIRLTRFDIFGLFGEHDYSIPVNRESHVTAIIAPNGAGKTLCLRLVAALFGQKWSLFAEVAFSRIEYLFSDGCKITIHKSRDETSPRRQERVNLTLTRPHAKPEKWSPKRAQDGRPTVEQFLPFITRIANDKWQHDNTGQIFSFEELIESYQSELPPAIVESSVGKMPEAIGEYCKSIHCRLIETQRLVVIKERRDNPEYRYRRQIGSTLAINEKAEALKEVISSELNKYATLSQSLDRSFPRRLIMGTTVARPDIAGQLAELDSQRRKLMEAGILDSEADQPVAPPPGKLGDAVAQVLQVHVDDNKQKLASLGPLLKKIELFKALIDQRFVTKDVRISKKKGIEVKTSNGEISLDRLSSGEQHQLVLFFELLFEISENSLILIDEPELSLHVAWQKKFIGDLLSIIELNKFDVILATHSPQLISHWDNLVVELGDVFEGSSEVD